MEFINVAQVFSCIKYTPTAKTKRHKILLTVCHKYDGLVKKSQADIYDMGTNVEKFVNAEIKDLKNDVHEQVESFVNAEIRSVQNIKGDVQEFVNKRMDDFNQFKDGIHNYINTELTSSMNKRIERALDEAIPASNVQHTSRSQSIHEESDSEYTSRMDELSAQLYELDKRLLECEQYSRRESVIISGIPECVQQGELQDVAIQIFKELDINVEYKDISAIHRLGKPRSSRYPAKVIVLFVNRKHAELCCNRKDRLKGLKSTLKLNLRFYESLATLNQESLRLCESLHKDGLIHEFYLRNGFVKIKTTENDYPVRINHPNVLREKFDLP